MERIFATAILVTGLLGATLLFVNAPHFAFIGATPKGVIVFNETTGNVEVRKPIFDSTSTTEPEDNQ